MWDMKILYSSTLSKDDIWTQKSTVIETIRSQEHEKKTKPVIYFHRAILRSPEPCKRLNDVTVMFKRSPDSPVGTKNKSDTYPFTGR